MTHERSQLDREDTSHCSCSPMQRVVRTVAILVLTALASQPASATALQITGHITNKSNGRPSGGDEVILYRVDQSMHEQARRTSDQDGTFQFDLPAGMRYLIAVLHQGVSYHTRTMKDSGQVRISVYDSAAPVAGQIREDSDTLFFDAEKDILKVTQFFVVSNHTSPPRTLIGGTTFDFELPAQATFDSVAIQPPETLPLNTRAWPYAAGNRYGIHYPIRPGTSKIRVVYHMAFSGVASLRPAVLHHTASMSLIVPRSMHLLGGHGKAFEYRGDQNGAVVYVLKNLKPGYAPTFTLEGSGETRTTAKAQVAAATTEQLSAAPDTSMLDFVSGTPARPSTAISSRTLFVGYRIPVVLTALLIAFITFEQARRRMAANSNKIPKT